ncbi:hypothetical protein [Mesorhizobium ventifaucium]|uniref:hypothetical protein n=1 Tax=Mesorhizobium ventifaucium TaxID=666020 RepID=UPI0020A82E0F|nr:hypothetical protein [Mesorhizobium ventifaucium]
MDANMVPGMARFFLTAGAGPVFGVRSTIELPEQPACRHRPADDEKHTAKAKN